MACLGLTFILKQAKELDGFGVVNKWIANVLVHIFRCRWLSQINVDLTLHFLITP